MALSPRHVNHRQIRHHFSGMPGHIPSGDRQAKIYVGHEGMHSLPFRIQCSYCLFAAPNSNNREAAVLERRLKNLPNTLLIFSDENKN